MPKGDVIMEPGAADAAVHVAGVDRSADRRHRDNRHFFAHDASPDLAYSFAFGDGPKLSSRRLPFHNPESAGYW